MPTKQKYLTIKENSAGVFFMQLKGLNGEKIMHSEEYASKSNAKKAMNDLEIIFRRFLEDKGYTVTHPSDNWTETDTTE